ncbi:MAG TPA: HAD family phosphatase [Candidatus Krumholzibacteria bacterium]|nr:HAD family phosphatase [Candidatus Krumholzibacteria bacterium]
MAHRPYDLICFDVDGTLVRHPSGKVIWEILNSRFTGDDSVNVQRHRWYDEGKITYPQWVEMDVQGWIDARATRADIVDAIREFEHFEGAHDTLFELKRRGARLAVISGTLDIVIDTMFPEHPFDDIYSNRLLFDEHDRLTGWRATPFDLEGKPIALRELSKKHDVALARAAFVGDGANDIPMVGVAGCVVAFNPRSRELERRANHVVREPNLSLLLELIG